MSRSLPRVLVCSGSERVGRGIRDRLREKGYGVRVVRDGATAWQSIEQGVAEVLVAETELVGLSGLELTRRVQELDPPIPVVAVVTGHDPLVVAEIANLGAKIVVQDGTSIPAAVLKSLQAVWPPQRSHAETALSRENRELLFKLQEQKLQLDQLARRTALLERDSQERKALDRLKCDFITLLSHEMRTPLTSILGFSEVLEQGLYDDGSELNEILGYIHQSGSRLTEFVNDALELFQWYSGMITLEVSPVEVEGWIHMGLQRIQAPAAERGITVSEKADNQLACIEGDPEVLDQTLRRLLDNAVKFTPAGGSIVVESHDMADGVRIDIIDDGVGIDPRTVDSLFSPLEVCGDLSHHTEGKGLSLALVKAAVKTHGGDVEISSEGIDRGTRVSLILPARIPEERRLRFLVSEPRAPHLLLAGLEA